MFQTGTFIGRGLPIILSASNKIPRVLSITVIWCRLLFIVIFYCFSLPLAVKYLYILLLSTSNGFICSTESYNAVYNASSYGASIQSKAAACCITSIAGGIAFGTVTTLFLI